MRGLGHAVEEYFTGEDPIEMFYFLRNLKDGADHMDISKGAAGRLLLHLLDGIDREKYKSHIRPGP
jgi:hypothetical protein